MFIAERLMGVGLYTFALVMTCFFLIYSTIGYKVILGCYTAILCVMAFCYEPYVTADLYRIYAMAREFAAWGFGDFFKLFTVTSSTPGARLFYWCAGRMGIVELIPAITCLICFSCVFYLLSRTVERSGVGRANLAAALFFFMATGNYMMMVSNIRTMLSLSLISYCFYRESVEKKYHLFHLVLYLTAASLHNLAVVMIALRLMAALLERKMTWGKRLAYLLLLGTACLWTWDVMGPFVKDVLETAGVYVFGDQYSYFWEYVIGSVVLMVELWIVRATGRAKCIHTEEYLGLRRFLLLCLLTALVFFFEFSIFYRLINCFAPILAAPLLMVALQNEERKGRGAMARTGVAAVSACLLFLSCCRGSLCSLKFFVL